MQEIGAVSEETAKAPEELGIPKHILNHFLAKIRGIRQTEDGRYYVEIEK